MSEASTKSAIIIYSCIWIDPHINNRKIQKDVKQPFAEGISSYNGLMSSRLDVTIKIQKKT
jgi:hypothetical protein